MLLDVTAVVVAIIPATNVSVSVAELLPGFGSVTPPGGVIVAVLLSVPVAAGEIVAVTVKVTLPPFGRLTVLLMLPSLTPGRCRRRRRHSPNSRSTLPTGTCP